MIFLHFTALRRCFRIYLCIFPENQYKTGILYHLSDSDYKSLKVISSKLDVSVVEAVRVAIRSYACLPPFSLSAFAKEINSVCSELKELI